MLLALSNNYPFPLRLSMYYHSNLGGYLYTPVEHALGNELDPIFKFIKYFNKNYAHVEATCLLQYGDFTLYIWDNDVEVYIDDAYFDDGNIGIYGHDESENVYYGKIYANYGTTTLNGTTYNYSPGEIYMCRSN
jgi:hypothetical protein